MTAAHFVTESKSCHYQVFVVESEPFSNSRTLLLRSEVGFRAQRLLGRKPGHKKGYLQHSVISQRFSQWKAEYVVSHFLLSIRIACGDLKLQTLQPKNSEF